MADAQGLAHLEADPDGLKTCKDGGSVQQDLCRFTLRNAASINTAREPVRMSACAVALCALKYSKARPCMATSQAWWLSVIFP